MKRMILCLSGIFSALLVITQDYQCVRDGAEYYYTDSVIFHAIRIDSVVPEGDDQAFYNYSTMIYDQSINCFSRFGSSWIGKKVLVKPDGKNVFRNTADSEIIIETQKAAGEHWTCYYFPDSNFIEATVAEIQEMEFITLSDSVKKITFQAFSSNGTPITHPINSMYLLLSKGYGLIRTINFRLFPDFSFNGIFYPESCSEFTLYGISEPPVGRQDLTADKVYDFKTGDEIHTHYNYTSSPYDYYKNIYCKNYILDKEFSLNNDSVIYLKYKCGYSVEHIPEVGNIYSYFKDTVCESYFIGQDSIINILPDAVIVNELQPDIWEYSCITSGFYTTSGKQIKIEWRGFFSVFPHECIEVIESKDNKDLGNDRKFFIENLGYYYDWFQAWDHGESNYPVYFKNFNDEWGTPYTFICDSLPTDIIHYDSLSNFKVSIFPNPMHSSAMLTILDKREGNYQLNLYNYMGMLVKELRFHSNELIIKRENLNNGIYFYILNENMKPIQTGKLIVN
jgi:hypothetical protein